MDTAITVPSPWQRAHDMAVEYLSMHASSTNLTKEQYLSEYKELFEFFNAGLTAETKE